MIGVIMRGSHDIDERQLRWINDQFGHAHMRLIGLAIFLRERI
jgi:hypothetical protein